MNEAIKPQITVYEDVFDEEMRGLSRRRMYDKSLSIADLQGILDALYIYQDNNICGRGPMGDMTLNAQIAAYESYIHEWLAEENRS